MATNSADESKKVLLFARITDFVFGSDSDDAAVLPEPFRLVYEAPFEVLKLDSTAAVAELRDAFRTICIEFCPQFVLSRNHQYTFEQYLLAYCLARGLLSGPATRLREALKTSVHMKIRPEHILQLLRPKSVQGVSSCNPSHRACEMLQVDYESSHIESFNCVPTVYYVFNVYYCLRRQKIHRMYADFEGLHEMMIKGLLVGPGFKAHSFPFVEGLSSGRKMGTELAQYIMKLHKAIAARRLFSPQLLKFLDVDFVKVHAEEEARIIKVLDTAPIPSVSYWLIVTEDWLQKWRKFVLGREARRNHPPGKIDNSVLLKPDGKPRDNLEIGVHYRSVNFNVWYMLSLTYGGGPTITRRMKEIYSEKVIGEQQARILLQCHVRRFLARCELERLYNRAFSSESMEAQQVIIEAYTNALAASVKKKIDDARHARKVQKLTRAAKLTQLMWRSKKNYEFRTVDNERLKQDQEVFARATHKLEKPTAARPFVIVAVEPIITIASASLYEVILQEVDGADGIPVKLEKAPHSGQAIVRSSTRPDITPGSLLLAINEFPMDELPYADIEHRLEDACTHYPVKLKLEKPPKNVPTWEDVLNTNDEDTKFQLWKKKLYIGLEVIKHNTGQRRGRHTSMLRIDSTSLSYRRKAVRGQERWKRVSLYSLKYVERGHAAWKNKHIAEQNILTLVLDKQSLVMQLVPQPGESASEEDLVRLTVECEWGFKRLVKEVKDSQWYLDKDGNAIKRTEAKRVLRQVQG